ncbi:unnamed protein product [Hapterophycus canaliculatus]
MQFTDAITYAYQTRDWTAKASEGDYVPNSGYVTVTPDSDDRFISIELPFDYEVESTETFLLDVTAPWGETSVTALKIFDSPSDFVYPSLKYRGFTSSEIVSEGEIGVVNVHPNTVRSNENYVLHYETRAWTADQQDFEPVTGELIFTPLDTSLNVEIPTNRDLNIEDREMLFVDFFHDGKLVEVG